MLVERSRLEAMEDRCVTGGANTFLTAPLHVAQAEGAIANLLDKRASIDEAELENQEKSR